MNNGLIVRNVIFINRAPFEKLDLKFIDGINVLSSENGRGKTTIMSYIVDALHEMAKESFSQSFESHETAWYRVSSGAEVMDGNRISLVYIRFVYQGNNIDYIDLRGEIDNEKYKILQHELPDGPIPISNIRQNMQHGDACKFCYFFNATVKKEELFSQHIATYFPAYRYEMPAYMNKVFQSDKSPFDMTLRFQGYLPNPIEVISGIDNIANWLMDVVLDWRAEDDERQAPESIVWHNVCNVLEWAMLTKKGNNHIRFGIGRRNVGLSRVSVICTYPNGEKRISPSVSYLSSGEKGLICIFGEILRQSDRIHPNVSADDVDGLVLVDEIDKHLHIRQQKEALPQLLNKFPNVQFVVSSHSPFLNMGLADKCNIPSQIIDLDAGGVACEPRQNELYNQVYEMMLHEKADYARQVEALQQKVVSITKPIILTEGKTDWKHIKHALKKLQEQGEYLDIDVVFDEFETDRGDSKLQSMCTMLSQLPNSQKIIAIYDTDKDAVKLADGETFKKSGGNVYELPIPDPQGYSCGISIEMMYPENDIKRVDANGRRLFLTSEFNLQSGGMLDGTLDKNCHNNALKDAAKNNLVKIIDKEVYDVTTSFDYALSKEAYAMYVLFEEDAYRDVDVSGFRMLFDIIKQIIND